ncbi:MAG: hypothetical protein GF307_09980 [candidate division Zixibacteria bacterium]|nr:hypothetical protein [candidate division Zixibacteria bacterium]
MIVFCQHPEGLKSSSGILNSRDSPRCGLHINNNLASRLCISTISRECIIIANDKTGSRAKGRVNPTVLRASGEPPPSLQDENRSIGGIL